MQYKFRVGPKAIRNTALTCKKNALTLEEKEALLNCYNPEISAIYIINYRLNYVYAVNFYFHRAFKPQFLGRPRWILNYSTCLRLYN